MNIRYRLFLVMHINEWLTFKISHYFILRIYREKTGYWLHIDEQTEDGSAFSDDMPDYSKKLAIIDWCQKNITWEEVKNIGTTEPFVNHHEFEENWIEYGNKEIITDWIPEYLYKYSPCNIGTLKVFTENTLKFSDSKEFNDPLEFSFLNSERKWTLIDNLDGNIGLTCFSAEPNNLLMFSHYADKCRGFCLKFETTHLITIHNEIEKELPLASSVLYVNKYPDLSESEPFQIITTKSVLWSYEKEYRWFLTKLGPGFHKFHPQNVLKGVIFGPKMESTDKEIVRKLVETRPEFEIYDSKFSDGEYKIELEKYS